MDSEDGAKKSRGGRPRGRGRGRVRGRGRGKKVSKASENEDEEMNDTLGQSTEDLPKNDENQAPPKIDLEADISQLEAPTFTTLNRGPPEPMLRLKWDHKVNLMGEKVLNPMIHCCDTCLKPILIYGRMIPCKHVFCLSCAKKEDKVCPRCSDKVSRVEQTGLGTVFMCTHDGTRYGNTGCRRTYLSQRDLQAHINHRHVSAPGAVNTDLTQDVQQPPMKLTNQMQAMAMQTTPRLKTPIHLASGDPRTNPSVASHPLEPHARRSPPPPQYLGHRPPMNFSLPPSSAPPSRSNLITVQISDSAEPPQPPASFPMHPYPPQPPPPYVTPFAPPVPHPSQPPAPYYPPAPQADYPAVPPAPCPPPTQPYPPPVPAPPPQYPEQMPPAYGGPQWHQPQGAQPFY